MRNEIPTSEMIAAIVRAILSAGDKMVIDGSFYKEIGPLVSPTQVSSPTELLAPEAGRGAASLLDFGCGTGAYRGAVEKLGLQWTGLNYADGMSKGARTEASRMGEIVFYDGVNIPFEDASFDLVFSMQVFEHLPNVPATFTELARILKPGGAIVGSVSQLEQMHDYSTYNFTPYGLKLASAAAGLKLEAVFPRFDAFTFLLRRLLIVTSGTNENSLSPHSRPDNGVMKAIEEFGKRVGADEVRTNLMKLMFASHFAFVIRK